jgi:hypothetical protein
MQKQIFLLLGTAVLTTFSWLPAQAQLSQEDFLMVRAREACKNQAAQQSMTVNRIVSTSPVRTNGQATGADVVMNVSRSGSTLDARCRFDSVAQTTTITTSGSSANAPSSGDFAGRGVARGSVFRDERQADSNLTFNSNSNRFSYSIFVPGGTAEQVNYNGTISRVRSTSADNPNNFVFEGSVAAFASSANGLRVVDTTGSCRIEVFDARIVSSSCNSRVSNSNTSFEGLVQF